MNPHATHHTDATQTSPLERDKNFQKALDDLNAINAFLQKHATHFDERQTILLVGTLHNVINTVEMCRNSMDPLFLQNMRTNTTPQGRRQVRVNLNSPFFVQPKPQPQVKDPMTRIQLQVKKDEQEKHYTRFKDHLGRFWHQILQSKYYPTYKCIKFMCVTYFLQVFEGETIATILQQSIALSKELSNNIKKHPNAQHQISQRNDIQDILISIASSDFREVGAEQFNQICAIYLEKLKERFMARREQSNSNQTFVRTFKSNPNVLTQRVQDSINSFKKNESMLSSFLSKLNIVDNGEDDNVRDNDYNDLNQFNFKNDSNNFQLNNSNYIVDSNQYFQNSSQLVGNYKNTCDSENKMNKEDISNFGEMQHDKFSNQFVVESPHDFDDPEINNNQQQAQQPVNEDSQSKEMSFKNQQQQQKSPVKTQKVIKKSKSSRSQAVMKQY